MTTASTAGIGELEWFEAAREAPAQQFDVAPAVAAAVRPLIEQRIAPGSRVGVATGSRGIAGVAEAVAAVVRALRERGAEPVLIPAMGSHGGATAAGQLQVLHELGIDPDALGVQADASMEVEVVGMLANGLPVHTARSALACDAVVPVNRVKPHSDFRARIESGLTKMLTIGLGKERGASTLHRAGFEAFGEMLPEAARLVCEKVQVPFGLALLDDAWHRPRRVQAVPGEEIIATDEVLLQEAHAHLARLPFPELDVLVLRELGKNISGAGMDPNVTGRFAGPAFPTETAVARLAVLDLTEESGGNAIGVGVADVVTERLRAKVDWRATYANSLAAKSPASGKLPLVAETDRAAVETAIDSLTGTGTGTLRLVALTNTLEVNHLAVSEALLGPARAAGYVVADHAVRAEFDQSGNLRRIGELTFFPG